MVMGRPAASRTIVENVMIPSPPSWIRTKMTICPKSVKRVAVSATTSPVTQMAEVDVKRASIKERRPETLQKGSIRSKVPTRMAPAKLMARICAGWNSCFLWMAMGPLLL
jgi:hypothetical protein